MSENRFSNCGRTFVVRPVWHREEVGSLRASSFDTTADGCATIGRDPDAFGVYEITGLACDFEWVDEYPTIEQARERASELAREAQADIVGWIAEQMAQDTEDRLKQSAILLNDYREASPKVRAGIDAALVCLCGYSLASALETLGVTLEGTPKKIS